MKIYVDKILPEGLNLAEKIDPGNISSDLIKQGTAFFDPIDVRANVTKTGMEVFVDVSLESPVEYTCSRCLAKIKDIFKKSFSVNYEVNSGDILDIDEDIRQEIMLDNPIKIVCKPDCKGLCPNCGQNFNIGECDCKK
ncbi:DUF177 domain-containing protein [Candidatus Omnitrophota bacterium]